MEHPDWGDVIPRLSYPIRKIRWKVKGQGKPGGARIVYFLAKSDNYIVFLYQTGIGLRNILPESSTYFSLLLSQITFKLKFIDKLKRVVLSQTNSFRV
jgi:hypothetical protein